MLSAGDSRIDLVENGLHPTRLETRTKESNMYASRGWQTYVRSESEGTRLQVGRLGEAAPSTDHDPR